MQDLEDASEERRKNREAESAFARRQWGSDPAAGSESDTDDDMRQTILGDVNHPAPIMVPQPKSSIGPALLAGLLAAGIPTAGLLGYLLARQSAAPSAEIDEAAFDDESVSIGLGRIEDYLRDSSP